jgi:F-type H+-transporting ATPase subunit epsilon
MFHLSIVTAEQSTYEGDVDMLIAPAVDGEIGILMNHHPIVTKLGPGAIRIVKPDKTEQILFTSGGFLEFINNKATILADVTENIEAIEAQQAHSAREKATELLRTAKSDLDREKLEEEIKVHTIRERLAEISKYRKQK